MPGAPDTADVPLTGGLDLNDPKNLPSGAFAVLDNVDFDPIRLRHGHVDDPVSDASRTAFSGSIGPSSEWAYGFGAYNTSLSGTLATPEVLNVRGVAALNDELLAWDGFRLLSRDPAPGARWTHVGADNVLGAYAKESAAIAHAEEGSLGWLGASTARADVAVGRNRTLYVWTEGTEAFYSLVDNATKAVIVTRASLDTTSSSVSQIKPVYLTTPGQAAGTFAILCNDTAATEVLYTLLPELDYSNTSTGTLISDLLSVNSIFDVRSHGGKAYVLAPTTGPILRVVTIAQNGATSTTTLDVDGNPPQDFSVGLAVHPDGTVLATWVSAGDIYAAFYSMSAVLEATLLGAVSTISTDQPNRLTCEFEYLKASNEYGGNVAWWVSTGSALLGTTSFRWFDQSGTLDTARNIGDSILTHQMIRVGMSNFITVGYARSTLQAQLVTLELLRNDAQVAYSAPVAACFRGTGYFGATSTDWTRQSARTDFEDYINGATFAQACDLAKLLPTASGVQQVAQGAGVAHYDFLPPFRTSRVGNSLWIAGGVVKEYDGSTVHEAGFLTYPEVTAAIVAGGTLPTTGGLQYRVYLCHENAKGELHRSAALTRTTSTPSVGNQTVRLTLPMIPYCTVDTVYWEIYRLDDGASTFKRLARVEPASLNTARSTDTTYDDTGSSITSNAVDPSPGYAPNGLGILDRICPPSCTMIAEGKERVWFAGGGIPARHVAYSRLYDAGEAPAWNEALIVNVPGDGPITGVGFLADWCVAFRNGQTFVFGGPGPDNLGISGEFDAPRLAAADSGCTAPDSILLLPFGLARQAQAGIRALTPGLDDIPVGRPVDKALDVSHPVHASALSPLWQQARWATDDGVYVLDYSHAPRWSRWTLDANAMCTYQGRVAVGTPTGSVLLECDESADTGRDGDVGYDMNLQTGWLKPGASGGLANLDWWYLVGDWWAGSDDSGLRFRVDYDYKVSGPQVDSRTWRPTEVVSSAQDVGQADLSGSTFGTGTPTWYPTFGNVDLRRRFNRRRVSACRFTIRGFGSIRVAINNLSIEYRPDVGMAGRGSRNLA